MPSSLAIRKAKSVTDPITGRMMWARNCWYVIAWEHEIPAAESSQLFSRKLLNEPILVYRKSDGSLVAMEDRCPHRHAPLSQGRKEGDEIRCGYHGLKFNAQGQCVEIPGMARAPAKICTRCYPVVSKNNWIFVWMGDPALADPIGLPDNFSCADSQWRNLPGYLHYDTPYLLICDNLLDFSHLSYVHEKTLGGSTAIAQSRPQIETVTTPGQRGIKVTRRVPNVPAPPFYQRFRTFDTLLDRWFIYEFLMPGTLLMHSGGRPVNDAPDDLSNAVQLHSCQTLSPETENSTHYFFQQSHQAGLGDDTVTQSIYDSLVSAFEEDRAMISAQHRNLGLAGGTAMVPLHFDAALLQFRKLVEAEVLREQGRS
jgi:phenylpropionate dioxygenase-like ring-hydroxylating dioxygenase large terminal subunit